MPGPWGRPTDTVTPEVSECSRIPLRRRPVSSAAMPCAPSCTIVTTCRVTRHVRGIRTRTADRSAVPATTAADGGGWVATTRCHTSLSRSTVVTAPRKVSRRGSRLRPGPERIAGTCAGSREAGTLDACPGATQNEAMRLGLQVPDFTWPGSPQSLGPTFAGVARNTEASGMASLWVMDHFFQISMVGPPEHEMLEGYSALAFAAGVTERISLGTMVTGVTYRHPGLLVKTVTTLDVLSGGRAILGIGAAWNEEEHRGLGVPYPQLAERFERLEETLQIAHQMWKGDEQSYQGKQYQLARPLNSPSSVQKPHPPILIGGAGERKTLGLGAQYGNPAIFR